MIDTRLNAIVGQRTSFVVNARTSTGEPVLKLDRDCDGQVATHEPALVLQDGESWRPVRDVGELKQFLETTRGRERGLKLGLWRDARSWCFFAPDGKVQEKEVTPMSGHPRADGDWTLRGGTPSIPHAETVWSAEQFHSIAEEPHEQIPATEYTAFYYTKVDPDCVSLGSAETPAGPVTSFREGLRVSRTHVEQVTAFGRDGAHWVPLGFKDWDCQGALDNAYYFG